MPSCTPSARAPRRPPTRSPPTSALPGPTGHDGPAGYERLLANDAVDVVYVATPHAHHHKIALAALNAGKHVLCEKALTVNAREAGELVALARAKGLFLMEAMWSRFLPSMQRAFRSPRPARSARSNGWVPIWLPGALLTHLPAVGASDGGGALLDITVYPLLWALGTLGFPQTVSATGWVNDDGVDAQNALTLGYHHGAQAQLTSSLLAHGPRTATVAGSAGFRRPAGPSTTPRTPGPGRVRRRPQRTVRRRRTGLLLRTARSDTLHPAGAHGEPGLAAGGLVENHAALRRRPRPAGCELRERRPLTALRMAEIRRFFRADPPLFRCTLD